MIDRDAIKKGLRNDRRAREMAIDGIKTKVGIVSELDEDIAKAENQLAEMNQSQVITNETGIECPDCVHVKVCKHTDGVLNDYTKGIGLPRPRCCHWMKEDSE